MGGNVDKLVLFRHEQNACKRGRPETPADAAQSLDAYTQHKPNMQFMYRTANTYYGPPRPKHDNRLMNHGKRPDFQKAHGIQSGTAWSLHTPAVTKRREFVIDNMDCTKTGIAVEKRLLDRSLS